VSGAQLSQDEVRSALAEKTVGIIGLGGLGSNAAMMLLRNGVMRFVLADHDVVEESNLNRQLFFPDQLGRPKTEALAETLRRIDPRVNLTLAQERVGRGNMARLFSKVDVLVEAVDTADDKAVVVEVASEVLPETPLVWAMGLAGYESANRIDTVRVGENSWLVGDLEADIRDGLPLLATRVMVAAAHEAHMAVRIMLGLNEA
jgi:sulfur carrier protein ThiS adenylyltransferase